MKSQVVVVALAVIGVLATAFTSYRVTANAISDQVVISCSQESVAPYCVYHRTTPGVLTTEYVILVGRESNRGVIYRIPYPAADVAATWNLDTALLTITMPGTALTITEAEYRDR